MRRLLVALTGTLVIAAAALLTAAAPAQAAPPPDRWGFAYVEDPTVPPWTLLDPAHQGTRPVSPVLGGKVGTGRFQVRFTRLGLGPQGNVHVTAVDPRGSYCETVQWFLSGRDEIVEVQCFQPGGHPADTPFTVRWTYNSALPSGATGSFATLQYEAGLVIQSYNSTGAGVSVVPIGTGLTFVRFEKVGIGGQLTGDLQVTALDRTGQPRWCKVLAWDDDRLDVVAKVACFDPAGRPLDSDYTASYHRERPVVSAAGPPKYFGYIWTQNPGLPSNFNNPAGGVGLNTLTVSGSNLQVLYPALNLNETHVQATAFGTDPDYCTIGRLWSTVGADLLVDVLCFDPSGAPAAEEAFITATNRG